MITLNNYKQFRGTLKESNPPAEWSPALKALWFDAKGNWEASHDIAQEIHSSLGSCIHGYLHRKEGDEWNAGYWYRRANKPYPKISLEDELKEIVEFIILGSDI